MDAPVQARTNLDSGMSKKQKVEPVAAEPSIAERLAELRKLNGLTLEELAQRASLTKSYLSKLERGLSSPTIGTVLKLADALGVTVDQLITRSSRANEILHIRAADRIPFSPSTERLGYTYEAIATERPDKAMQPFIMVPPFTLEEDQPMASHAGEELIFVVSGEMEVLFDDRTVRMSAGDSLYFNASIPHRSRSLGRIQAQALVVVSDRKKA
ncbi:transcriptional regulator with XRE-family HTH domain [Cupriavidus metallidurans]|jgi:transcriptional regulator with XRE-family HTH domain|uniref:Transcriptional regulator, Xre/Cro/CI family n=2 Tax=Cupriavidus metallidurans TaxID=119219 RepID=Q1LFU9_CUPMC|nr:MULTISPECIES: XRE family transcriptional regulator [Cupriavidus]ABF10977.1 transcriptional regulator, Xre/Cro/CI family [Cupriavidus metallidurans CH34]AVA34856.1 XRE family transcriptional regulator [Cupriavidus metallidurans]KWR86130.1 XRE family transcriptional regulator [Cupriavidus sp. SHE]KWW39542.1 HTH-type transcriptional regulator PuuR [Cupriavidus metallidurans]MDE4920759.1 XRE family transcriptional regulator [Cupriavidus metallidurans]